MEILESSQFEAILGIGPPTVSRLSKPRPRIRLLVWGFGQVFLGYAGIRNFGVSNVSWLKDVRISASATLIFLVIISVMSTIHSHCKRGCSIQSNMFDGSKNQRTHWRLVVVVSTVYHEGLMHIRSVGKSVSPPHQTKRSKSRNPKISELQTYSFLLKAQKYKSDDGKPFRIKI